MSLAKQTQNTFDLTPSTDIYVIGWNDYNAQNISNLWHSSFSHKYRSKLHSHTISQNYPLTCEMKKRSETGLMS